MTSQNTTEQKSLFKTSDLQIAVVLVLSGFSLRGTDKEGGRAVFCFIQDDRINSTIAQFYGGQLRLDPRQVFELWKNLRTLTFSVTGNTR